MKARILIVTVADETEMVLRGLKEEKIDVRQICQPLCGIPNEVSMIAEVGDSQNAIRIANKILDHRHVTKILIEVTRE